MTTTMSSSATVTMIRRKLLLKLFLWWFLLLKFVLPLVLLLPRLLLPADRLELLQPGTFCFHKSWGAGRVDKWDRLGVKVVIVMYKGTPDISQVIRAMFIVFGLGYQ